MINKILCFMWGGCDYKPIKHSEAVLRDIKMYGARYYFHEKCKHCGARK